MKPPKPSSGCLWRLLMPGKGLWACSRGNRARREQAGSPEGQRKGVASEVGEEGGWAALSGGGPLSPQVSSGGCCGF